MNSTITAPVSTIMTRDVETIRDSASLSVAEKIIKRHNIRHLPVVNDKGHLLGIIGRTDLLRLSFADNFGEAEDGIDKAIYNMLKLEEIMVRNPITIQLSESIKTAAELLAKHKFHALPVLDGDMLVGILSTTDLIKYFLRTEI